MLTNILPRANLFVSYLAAVLHHSVSEGHLAVDTHVLLVEACERYGFVVVVALVVEDDCGVLAVDNDALSGECGQMLQELDLGLVASIVKLGKITGSDPMEY